MIWARTAISDPVFLFPCRSDAAHPNQARRVGQPRATSACWIHQENTIAGENVPAAERSLFDEPAPLRVRDRLKPGVRAELAVDVMEVVAQRLGGDTQLAGDGRGVAACGEQLEDA